MPRGRQVDQRAPRNVLGADMPPFADPIAELRELIRGERELAGVHRRQGRLLRALTRKGGYTYGGLARRLARDAGLDPSDARDRERLRERFKKRVQRLDPGTPVPAISSTGMADDRGGAHAASKEEST